MSLSPATRFRAPKPDLNPSFNLVPVPCLAFNSPIERTPGRVVVTTIQGFSL